MSEPDFEKVARTVCAVHHDSEYTRMVLAERMTKALRQMYEAGLERARIVAAIHSQYPIESDFDRGYDRARKDAAEEIRRCINGLAERAGQKDEVGK